MIWTTVILGLLVLFALQQALGLYKHIRIAQRTGLPYVIVPLPLLAFVIPTLLSSKWGCYITDTWLPAWLADLLNDNYQDKRWTVKNRRFQKLGPVYMKVNPDSVSCMVSDAGVAARVCAKRADFPKPIWMYSILNLYGENIVTSEGPEWARHRRHTAPSFNDKNNLLVWQQTISQTNGMLAHWRESCADGSPSNLIIKDISTAAMKLTLNVFSSAGFGVQLPFKPIPLESANQPDDIFKDATAPHAGFDFTFRSAMAYMSENIRLVVLAKMLPESIQRRFFGKEFAAHRDLGSYIHRLIGMGQDENSGTSNLLQGMLASRREYVSADAKEKGLSDQEVAGNTYMFIVAGHETTATTMRFAMVLLALHQRVQDWVYEGIVEAMQGESQDETEWDFNSMFAKLVTPLCVMLETMRLYPPVVSIPKWTGDTPRSFTYNDREIVLPPYANINLSANGLHYSEEYWGADVESFSPARWDAQNKDSFLAQNADLPGLAATGLGHATIHKPVRGAYMPFSDGHRACVGYRFAQVEFVVALAVLLKKYRVELRDGSRQGRERAEKILRESTTVVTLGMRENVELRFVAR